MLLKEKKTGKKNDNWNFWILVFLVQKWPFRDAYVFSKKVCWNTYFYSVLGCALFGPSCQKREILDTHPKKKKIWLITEKLIFEYFWFFLFFSFFFFFVFFHVLLFFVFFGGFKGHVRWPKGPPHLALNPPYLFFFLFLFCFCFFVSFYVFLEGLKAGEVSRRATSLGVSRYLQLSLALNPPYLFFVFCLFCFFFLFPFLSLFLIEKHCFSP